MSQRLPNYLRTFRKKAGLSQDEVATLLGSQSGTRVSRHEAFQRQPCLWTAWAYEALFRTPMRELFAGDYSKVERQIIKRAKLLMERLNRLPRDPARERKLQFLRSLFDGDRHIS